tara:strand:+ start:1126 stop:1593 length:468 start_codon:yes stop_codon:yes gene_type:complete
MASGKIIQLAKQEVFKNDHNVVFVIDVYKQHPTAHWDSEDAKKFNVPWINVESVCDFDDIVGESSYGTHGYQITIQDSGEPFYSDFYTMWDVESCLENAYQDIRTYCSPCGDSGWVLSNDEDWNEEVQKCDTCNVFDNDEHAQDMHQRYLENWEV